MGTVDRNRSNRQEEMAAVKSKIFIVVGAFLLLWFARFVWDYFDPTSDANQAMQIQLKVFGSAMSKYNADVLLTYDRGGLSDKLGRVWVCWGDLRTERLRPSTCLTPHGAHQPG